VWPEDRGILGQWCSWAGVICRTIGGGDKGDSEDEGIEDKGSKGDGGGNR
jgi:hypothetical protein